MPTGPQGQKRPEDDVECAVMVAKIATGEIEETKKEPSRPSPLRPKRKTKKRHS